MAEFLIANMAPISVYGAAAVPADRLPGRLFAGGGWDDWPDSDGAGLAGHPICCKLSRIGCSGL